MVWYYLNTNNIDIVVIFISSAPLNNTVLWHCLGKKHLGFEPENNITPGVLIKEIRYTSDHMTIMVDQ